jgi:electron transfer flavoprotein alpha subunit
VSVLVILEQQGGEWHRMSWETLAAAQEFAATLGEPVEAAVAGKGIGTLAAEAASKKVAKVWAVEHDLLDAYTADA